MKTLAKGNRYVALASLGGPLALVLCACPADGSDPSLTPDGGATPASPPIPLCEPDSQMPCELSIDVCPTVMLAEGSTCMFSGVGCSYCPGDPTWSWLEAVCREGQWEIGEMAYGG